MDIIEFVRKAALEYLYAQPATVIRWHRQGFKYYWRWKSKKPGRPKINRKIITLIHRMSRENPTWGTPRIQSELQLLGQEVAESTIDKYRIKPKNGPSQTWHTFLRNHMHETIACDFFVVPTATFRVLFGFVVLHHQQRRIIHFNATHNPTAEWTAVQVQQALFNEDHEPRFLLRDRDSIYGEVFRNKVKSLELEEVAPGAWHIMRPNSQFVPGWRDLARSNRHRAPSRLRRHNLNEDNAIEFSGGTGCVQGIIPR